MLPLALAYILVVAGVTLALDAAGVPRVAHGGVPVFSLVLLAVNIVLVALVFTLLDRGRVLSPASSRVAPEEVERLRHEGRPASSAARVGGLTTEAGD